MASIGLAPQDLKYRGERTRLTIGRRNIFREFVTINRGTAGGGGETTIGDNNLFMAYVHVAHDCHVGNDTIFGPHATLGGHVGVDDFANVSAGSAVHQFCRVGRHAFIGGYSVVTKDALPFARTIGSRPARIFGVNTIGLQRRGFTPNTITQLRHAYRYLLQSKLNTTRALAQIEQDSSLTAPEVRYMVEFIRSVAARCDPAPRRPPRRGARRRRMKLGLLAGNGRFPFLVLDAARAQGHDVTIIALKEETFTELNAAAERHAAQIHWISLGQLGTCITLLKSRRRHHRGHGRTGEAHQDFRRHHART